MSRAIEPPQNPIVVTGPTASGKGALAFEIARRIGGEIISMDSMKVYRELDVATAKPSPERRTEVPYHLIDIVNPEESFSAGDYLPLLRRAIEEVAGRGRLAIVTGGTALYLKAFLEGFRTGPAADWELRNRLTAEGSAAGPEALHERLRAIDATAASKIHPRDLRRIVRALEVQEKTGAPISKDWKWGQGQKLPSSVRVFGLDWPRAALYRRIDLRVETMAARGLFEEALRLKERNPPLSLTASQAMGYKEIWEGTLLGRSPDDIVRRIQRGTRRFAKSQLTWFRKLPVEWIQPEGELDPQALADAVLERIGSLRP